MPKIIRANQVEIAPQMTVYSSEGHLPIAGTLAMPVRDHLNAATVSSLLAVALNRSWVPEGKSVHCNICQGSILTMQRNQLLQLMEGDWILFVDDDMIWQPEDVKHLLDTREQFDLDIVGGLCFRRTFPYQPTLYMRQSPTAGVYRYLETWEEGAVIEVDATGMAFCLITVRAIEKMVNFYEGTTDWVLPPIEERRDQIPPNIFRWEGQLGEDLRFCQEAKAAGMHIFVDTAVKVGHIGERTVGSNDYFRAMAERTPEGEEACRIENDKLGVATMTHDEAVARITE